MDIKQKNVVRPQLSLLDYMKLLLRIMQYYKLFISYSMTSTLSVEEKKNMTNRIRGYDCDYFLKKKER